MGKEVDEQSLKQAEEVMAQLRQVLDERKIPFEERPSKDPNRKMLFVPAVGNDLPMELYITANPKLDVVEIISPIPVKIEKEKYPETAELICFINEMVHFGHFCLEFNHGGIYFSFNHLYADSLIPSDVWFAMISVGFHIIDEFNDTFLMFSKGLIDKKTIMKKYDYEE